jgi:hypothetical protein
LRCYLLLQVRLNGIRGPLIKHRRGLRQGDPLSPYLFILAIDTLQYILGRATEQGILSPLRDRAARLRLSLYAVDAAVFINPVRQDVELIMAIMQRFGDATGLRINVSKSTAAPIRCSQINLDEVLQSFTGGRVSFPRTYLGLPITMGRLKIVHLQTVYDPAAVKFGGWHGQMLNIGGRRELVRTVLDSLPTYTLTALKPPKKFYKDLDKLRRRFLWAGNQQLHGGKCKISWSHVCRPLHRGGLGILDLERFGRASRLRWLWFQWKYPDKVWNGSGLPIDGVDEALFAAATQVHVHNGNTAKFWTSSWINGLSPAAMFPSLYDHSKKKKRSVADALQNDNWIRDLMHDVTTAIFVEYIVLWIMADAAQVNPSDPADDEIIWTRSADGNYSAKSAYSMQFDGSVESSFPTKIWRVWAPSRCKFFVWLMLQNRIWTADRLLMREWPNQYFCPFAIGT